MTSPMTPTEALDLLGEPTASELLERYFDLLTPTQRRFLVARIENQTDAAAFRQAHISSPTTLEHWRKTSTSFEKVYQAAKRSTPQEMNALTQMRFGYIAGSCLSVIEEFMGYEAKEEEIKSGIYYTRRDKAVFALNVLKEMRVRAGVLKRGKGNSKDSQEIERDAVLELTKEAMIFANQSA